jgi:hypothetical protein
VRPEQLNGNDNKDDHFLEWSSKNLPALWGNLLPPFSKPEPTSPEEMCRNPMHNNRYEYVMKTAKLRTNFQE